MYTSARLFFISTGGRIDHAHHEGRAFPALNDTVALSEAVQKAINLTSEEDTLIVVTADHSVTFTMGGSPSINNPILGKLFQLVCSFVFLKHRHTGL